VTRQEQSGGSESQLCQAGGDIVVQGVSAADVVQITRTEVARVLEDLTLSARTVAEERVKALGDRILERFAEAPGLLGAFSEPDFQYSLGDAGRAAASNEDAHTEQLLVDLLANRAESGNTSRARLATSHAIKAADKLSLETLNGLTSLWAVGHLTATEVDRASAHVATARSVAEALATLGLPSEANWLEEAEALNLARMYSGGLITRKPYRECIRSRIPAALSTGIAEDKFAELIGKPGSALPELAGLVTEHQLKAGFLALGGEDRESFLKMLPDGFSPSAELEELITANGFGVQDPDAVARLDELLDQSAAVQALAAWWDGTPYVDVTVVGRVVGFVNARRHMAFHGAQTVSELLSPTTP